MIIPNILLLVHPPKCAGTSIRMALRRHFYNKLKYKSEDCEPPNSGHWKSSKWLEFSPSVPPIVIGCVRNPWDRAVSFYYHMLTHQPIKAWNYNITFEDWMKAKKDWSYKRYVSGNSIQLYFEHEGKIIPNFIVKQENFEDDLKELLKLLDISPSRVAHERHRTKRPLNDDYRKHYNDETKSIVEEASQWEINKFGYKF